MGWNDFALIVATFLGPVGAVQTVGPPGRAGDARAAPPPELRGGGSLWRAGKHPTIRASL